MEIKKESPSEISYSNEAYQAFLLAYQSTVNSQNTELGTKRPNRDKLNFEPAKRSHIDPVMLDNPEAITMAIDVPDNYAGLVVGKGGSTINRIGMESGCSLCRMLPAVPTASDGMRQVLVKGTKTQIELAQILIGRVIDDFETKKQKRSWKIDDQFADSNHPGMTTIEVLIPKENLGSVVGKSGQNIHSIEHQFGVNLKLIQDNPEATGPKPLRIQGLAENVEWARQYIEASFCQTGVVKRIAKEVNYTPKNEYTPTDRLGGATLDLQNQKVSAVRVIVPGYAVGKVKGTGGQSIKSISEKTGARIIFNIHEEKTALERSAIIYGTASQIIAATKLISDLIVKADPQPEIPRIPHISPTSIPRMAYVPRKPFQRMAHDTPEPILRKAHVPQKTYTPRAVGFPLKTDPQKRNLPVKITEFMKVQSHMAGVVLGKKGETVKQLSQQSGAKIQILDQLDEAGLRTFKIYGAHEEVQQAIRLINTRIEMASIPYH